MKIACNGSQSVRKSPLGFTLAELIVVITVLAILATIGFVALSGHLSSARDSSRLAEVDLVSKAVELSAVQNGKYPMPVAAEDIALVSFTGGVSGNTVVTQWVATAANVRNLGGSFGKKKQIWPFIYSVLGGGVAYQVAAEFENGVSASFPYIDNAYALEKFAYVDGTYRTDPSLPSLVVSSWSVGVAGLFSPDVCFVMHGGSNLPSSSSGCVPKKSFPLNSVDSSLVGYWDMETLCISGSCWAGNDGKLADMSGNGYYGTLSGSILPISATGLLWKGYQFSGSGIVETVVPIRYGSGKVVSVEMLVRTSDTTLSQVWQMLIESSPNLNSNTWGFFITDFDLSNVTYFTDYRMNAAVRDAFKLTPPQYFIQRSSQRSVPGEYKIVTALFDKTGLGPSARLFINGREQHGDDMRPDSAWNILRNINSDVFLDYPLNIWWRSDNLSIGTLGTIDEVKVYSRTLSDAEVLQHARSAWF